MEIEGSTLRLEADDLTNSMLMGVELPSGAISGGLLVANGERTVFVAFSDVDVEAGDDLLVPPDLRLIVDTVREADLDDHPVTVLGVRPTEADGRRGPGRAVGR